MRALWCVVVVVVAAGCDFYAPSHQKDLACKPFGDCPGDLVCGEPAYPSPMCIPTSCNTDSDCPTGFDCYLDNCEPIATCNPFTHAGCGASQGCLVDDGFPVRISCQTVGSTAVGTSCSSDRSCVRGAICSFRCQKICDPMNLGSLPCPTGTSCHEFTGSSFFFPVGRCY